MNASGAVADEPVHDEENLGDVDPTKPIVFNVREEFSKLQGGQLEKRPDPENGYHQAGGATELSPALRRPLRVIRPGTGHGPWPGRPLWPGSPDPLRVGTILLCRRVRPHGALRHGEQPGGRKVAGCPAGHTRLVVQGPENAFFRQDRRIIFHLPVSLTEPIFIT